jgi:hypothetical protein
MQTSAIRTESTVVTARLDDSSAKHLTLRHLREFIEKANLAELADDTPVRLTDKLQTSSHWHTVTIEASTTASTPHDLTATQEGIE